MCPKPISNSDRALVTFAALYCGLFRDYGMVRIDDLTFCGLTMPKNSPTERGALDRKIEVRCSKPVVGLESSSVTSASVRLVRV
jgi:hypothetical protein